MKNLSNLLRVLFCLGLLILLSFKGQAQATNAKPVRNLNGGTSMHYQNAFGIRLGNQFGLTAKRYLWDGDMVEAILSSHIDKKGIVGTVLYEWHRNAFEGRNLYWFYGGGPHVGYYQYKNYYEEGDPENTSDKKNFVEFGVDAIIGLEYGFQNTPLTLSLDVKPFLSSAKGNTGGIDGALSVRYVF